MSTVAELTELGSYLDTFGQLQQRTSRQPEWLRSLREKGFAQFCDLGFPATRDEAWRFTNVAPIAREVFALPRKGSAEVTAEDLDPFILPGAACRLVFVNGHFVSELSDWQSLPSGVEANSLAAEIGRNAETLEAHLGRHPEGQADAFCSLNAAFIEDGAYVRVARGTVLHAPIHLLFVSTGEDSPLMVHPRNLLIAECESQADIVEEHISLGDATFFSNSVTELIAAENAVVSHHKIECENRKTFHIATLHIRQERNSNVRSHSVLIGGALVRNNVHPVLAGEGSESLINGLFLGKERQHLDNYMMVEHASPRCTSHQFYNGILRDRAHGVFHGRILVHKDAQQTNAKQTNRNLLLSDDAQIDTKPQLEIYADDVRCTHGATIGQIDENALYYLRSRGLEECEARQLLLSAFANECLERIQSEVVRKYIGRIVHRSLSGEVSLSGAETDAGRRWEEAG